jgi:hypothetical protein
MPEVWVWKEGMEMKKMSHLLGRLEEGLTGRYVWNFKKQTPGGHGSNGPDDLFVANPTKDVQVELLYYGDTDKWFVDLYDENSDESSPDGKVFSTMLGKGIDQKAAEKAAIDMVLKKYLMKKGRGIRESAGSTEKPVKTIKALNDYLYKNGMSRNWEAVKGKGYVYFAPVGDKGRSNGDWPSSIMVYALNQMSLDKWLDFAKGSFEDVGRDWKTGD